MQVLVCGSIAYDNILHVDGRLADNISKHPKGSVSGVLLVSKLTKHLGGCAGNIAYNLTQMGIQAYPMATVGRDIDAYLAWMRKNCIPADYLLRTEKHLTSQAYLLTDGDNNQIIAFHPGAMNICAHQKVPHFMAGKIGILAPEGKEGMLAHAKQMKEAHMRILFDPGQGSVLFSRTELETFIDVANWMVCNEAEMDIITTTLKASQDAISKKLQALFITKGAHGSLVCAGTRCFEIPPVEVESVRDPTGCGDAYRAAIIYAILHAFSWREAGCLGSILGALKSQSHGGQNHTFPHPQVSDTFSRLCGRPLIRDGL